MKKPAVVGIAAWSGVGKTALIEALIPELNDLGLRIAALKHAEHDLVLDREDRDSGRFSRAGAAAVLAASDDGTLLLTGGRRRSLAELAALLGDADLILAEGFKGEPIAQIGLYRPASGKGLTAPAERFLAIVTDDPAFRAPVPVFSFDQVRDLARFLLEHRDECILPEEL